MPTATGLVTQAEFADRPNPPGGYIELRHGEVVTLTYPKRPHTKAQVNLVAELTPRPRGKGKVVMEMPYCPLPEYEVWGADVAYVSKAQWSRWNRHDWLPGSPLLLIEVLSASNTKSEIADKRKTSFAGGCQEFWLVDPKKRTVHTWTLDGVTRKYNESDSIPLTIMDAEPLPVSAIFNED